MQKFSIINLLKKSPVHYFLAWRRGGRGKSGATEKKRGEAEKTS